MHEAVPGKAAGHVEAGHPRGGAEDAVVVGGEIAHARVGPHHLGLGQRRHPEGRGAEDRVEGIPVHRGVVARLDVLVGAAHEHRAQTLPVDVEAGVEIDDQREDGR